MNPNQRLADLEKILQLRYEALGAAEIDLAMHTDTFQKTAIKQRIREQVLPEIRKYENEYWETVRLNADTFVISDTDADNVIVQVVQEVNFIKNDPSSVYSDELISLLTQIRDRLNEPGRGGAVKLKATLPLLPPIVSCEVELDTTSSLGRILQPIKRLFKATTNDEKKK